MYAHIKENKILQLLESLPVNWGNTSNFNALSDSQVSDLSWAGYDDRFIRVTETPKPQYNSQSQTLAKDYSIVGNSVVEVWSIVELSQEETATQIANQEEIRWEEIRLQRNELLKNCDWTQLRDCPLNEEKIQEWSDYRQTLRDLPQLFDSPESVVFPNIPAP